MEEILYTALLTVTTTGMLEGGDIASYSDKDIKALVEQSKEQIKENGEKALKSGKMPDDAHLEIMELNPPTARGKMAIYQMGNMDDTVADPKSQSLVEEQENSRETLNRIPNNPATIGHIFRDAEGHISDTPQNRALLEDVANSEQDFLGYDKYGNAWYRRQLPNGTFAWVEVRNRNIFEGGINKTQKTWNPETGLKKT